MEHDSKNLAQRDFRQIIDDATKCHLVGWTNDGTVTWLYWTIQEQQLYFLRMSPIIARKIAKECSYVERDVRERLNDCSYSAASARSVDENLFERFNINPSTNPHVRTLGIGISWSQLDKLYPPESSSRFVLSTP